MQVGPPSDDDNLGIAWIAQVCRQLPLSRPVPAHVEEYLDDDEDDDNSGDRGERGGGKLHLVGVQNVFMEYRLLFHWADTHMYQYSSISMDFDLLWPGSHSWWNTCWSWTKKVQFLPKNRKQQQKRGVLPEGLSLI